MKERKFRVNNSNFAIHPLRLSVRNLPRAVDASKLRQALVGHLARQSFVADAGDKKERRIRAEGMLTKVKLVRDMERKTESKERRSKGFGFMAFKDHRSAMASLEFLNDNPDIFGGGKRPIVEFAIEDKRKLRMQEELYAKHAHKLLPNAKGADGKGKGKGKGNDEDKGESVRKFKHKKKPGMSRGQRQRERRRQEKAAKAEKAERKDHFEAKTKKIRQDKAAEKAERRQASHKRKKKFEPDTGPVAKKPRAQRHGELNDDFELRALERFRSGKR